MNKKKRQKDLDLIEYIKTELSCVACQKPPPIDAHHITTVGARGDDIATNLLPVCRICHTSIHKEGMGKMIKKYPTLLTWLKLAKRTDVLRRIKRK